MCEGGGVDDNVGGGNDNEYWAWDDPWWVVWYAEIFRICVESGSKED